jgi:hypothetical protein
LFPNGQHRGPVRRFRPRVAGTLVQKRGRGEHTGRAAGPVRPAQLAARESCGIYTHVWGFAGLRRRNPTRMHVQKRAAQKNRRKTGGCGGPANASGAPGRGAAAKPRQAWLPSVHLLCQPGRPLPVLPGLTRLPRLVARGYLTAVPGRVNVRSTFLRRNHQPAKPWRVTNS